MYHGISYFPLLLFNFPILLTRVLFMFYYAFSFSLFLSSRLLSNWILFLVSLLSALFFVISVITTFMVSCLTLYLCIWAFVLFKYHGIFAFSCFLSLTLVTLYCFIVVCTLQLLLFLLLYCIVSCLFEYLFVFIIFVQLRLFVIWFFWINYTFCLGYFLM